MKKIQYLVLTTVFIIGLMGVNTVLTVDTMASELLSEPFKLNMDSIKKIQSRLKELGYDTGPVDGVLGPVTSRAIIRFQIDNGLLQTGYPDASFRETVSKKKSEFTAVTD